MSNKLLAQLFCHARVVSVQATIKLYVLTAMFEILDKLLISFGQDTLDSLYWSAKKNSDRK